MGIPDLIPAAALWPPQPENLRLGRDEVHVWCTSLNLPSSQRERLRQTLAADEQSRADRFVFQKDRHQFITARGILRAILGQILDEAPDKLRFSYNHHGRPALTGDPDGLRFNVSHSHGLALFAVTRERSIGVDIERIRPVFESEQIAHHFFSPREEATLLALPESLRNEAFFTCWTRKEAYIKARGEGLSIPLDQFDVSLAPGEPAVLLSVEGDEVERWSLRQLDPGHGYVAALAVEGDDWRLHCWHASQPSTLISHDDCAESREDGGSGYTR